MFEDLVFRRCTLLDCFIHPPADPARRWVGRDVRLIQCSAKNCELTGGILEDSLVDGLLPTYYTVARGCAFKHVVLRGKMQTLMFVRVLNPADPDSKQQQAYDDANTRYYADVDWALDIREVECDELDIRNVPARLIRRDPDSQAIVTRHAAESSKLQELNIAHEAFRVAIKLMLTNPAADDVVLVAGKRSRTFARQMEAIRQLREAGIADPD